MKKLSLILIPIVCLLWVGFIFSMSSDVNSNVKSIEISEQIKNEVRINGARFSTENINIVLRKGGHFFEYLVLGMLLCHVAKLYSFKLKSCVVYILFIILLLANLDEFYQGFVGRSSRVADSLIDLCGGIFGIVVYCVAVLVLRKRKINNNMEM
jgi:VanZ family protein